MTTQDIYEAALGQMWEDIYWLSIEQGLNHDQAVSKADELMGRN